MSKLNELCQVKPSVKLYKFTIFYSSWSFLLVQCFFLLVILARKIIIHQCEIVGKHQQGGERIFFFILCSKSWIIYEAILCLWRHCLNRFFSLLRGCPRKNGWGKFRSCTDFPKFFIGSQQFYPTYKSHIYFDQVYFFYFLRDNFKGH